MIPLLMEGATPSGGGSTAGIVVDLLNLQWWQGLIAIAGVVGLSPAPWLLGMARDRIAFTAPMRADYDARVADLKEGHARAVAELVAHHQALIAEKDAAYTELKTSRDYYRDARLVEKARNDELTDQLVESVELARTGFQVLRAFDKAAETKGEQAA